MFIHEHIPATVICSEKAEKYRLAKHRKSAVVDDEQENSTEKNSYCGEYMLKFTARRVKCDIEKWS